MMNFKATKWRSKKYLDFVRSLPCSICGAPADHAHHIIGVGGMGGMGTKSADYTAMPMCAGCHRQIHDKPEMWNEQWQSLANTLFKAIDNGVLDVKS